MRRRDQRLIMIVAAGAVLAGAMALTLTGLRQTAMYFAAPSDLASVRSGERIRLGGLVVEGTVRRAEDGSMHFSVTDGAVEVEVRYADELPSLFREGQGVVAEGRWQPGQAFEAERVLARHDETYMPREVAEAIKDRGQWKGEDAP